MMIKILKKYVVCLVLMFASVPIFAGTIHPGADQSALYLPYLKEKRVAIFANQTSVVGKEHLLDFLLEHHVNVVKVFSPEHGFRGEAADGDQIKNSIDTKTHIPIVSLYGKKLKPSAEDLQNVDIIVFDIQDVGVRFYTFISSLQKLMEAAIENHKALIILDRPNPNGFYVDGPVQNPKYKSFTAMQPVPFVYGMTMGEYAKMLVGQEWLDVKPKFRAHELQLMIIPCVNYTHNSYYVPPIKPSPNLPNINSIYLYPAVGLMEYSIISVGRGTNQPFEVFGHPKIHSSYHFIPRSQPGSPSPRYKNQVCYGWHIQETPTQLVKEMHGKLQIKYLLQAYQAFPDKKAFFGHVNVHEEGKPSFPELVLSGATEQQIRASWEPELSEFKVIRKKYLLYPDF